MNQSTTYQDHDQALKPVVALVLAGGENRIPLYPGYRPDLKAVIEFAGEPSLVHVLRALRQAKLVSAICVVGPPKRLRRIAERAGLADGVAFIPGAETLVESVINGLSHFSDNHAVLLTTADLPLLNAAAIDQFLGQCQMRSTLYERNIFFCGVDRSAFSGEWEHAPIKFLKFAGGQAVVHGNLALLDPALAGHRLVRRKLDALYGARKHPMRAAFVLGLRIALAYLLGAYVMRLVTLRLLANLISSSLKLGLIPVTINYPGVALDIDEPKDYRFVKGLMERRDQDAAGAFEQQPAKP